MALAHTHFAPSRSSSVNECVKYVQYYNDIILCKIMYRCVLYTFQLYMVCADVFWSLGIVIAQHSTDSSSTVGMRRFRALFGATPTVCASLWNPAHDTRPEGTSPVHLLWMLLFLKCYGTEAQTRALVDADEKTVRKWVWAWVQVVADLDIVSNTI